MLAPFSLCQQRRANLPQWLFVPKNLVFRRWAPPLSADVDHFHPLSLSISLFVPFSPSIWPPKGKSPMRRLFIQQLLEEVVFLEPRVWLQPVSTAKGGQRLTEVKSSHKRAVSYWPLRASEQGAGLLWPTANSQAGQSKSRSRNRATKEAAIWQRYTIRPTGWQLRKGLWPSPSLLLMVCGLFFLGSSMQCCWFWCHP